MAPTVASPAVIDPIVTPNAVSGAAVSAAAVTAPVVTGLLRFVAISLAAVSIAACASPTSVIEIPPCADRVDVTGQASRMSPTRLEFDHTLDPPLAKSVITFQAGSDVRTVEAVSSQPEPVRAFVGGVAGVAGAILFSTGMRSRAAGATRFAQDELIEVVAGASLMTVGVAAVLTGWHPPYRYTSFPEACPAAGP